MKIKGIGAVGSALILALASLFSFAFGGEAQAAGTTLYWCEFSSNGDFNTASNWNTNSDCTSGSQEVPVSGDSLVFDDTALTSGINVDDDISGLDLNSITFQGNSSSGYTITDNDFSLDNGITDTGTGSASNGIDNNITLTGDQSFDSSSGNDSLSFYGTINIGSSNLTFAANINDMYISGSPGITGSGNLIFNGATGSGNIAAYYFNEGDPSFSGSTTIASAAEVQDDSTALNALGTGTITIDNDGSLKLGAGSDTGTITNNLVLNGSGDGVNTFGAIQDWMGAGSSDNTTLTLSGDVTLDGNAQVVNGYYSLGFTPSGTATFDFTGGIAYNGFTLTANQPSTTSTVIDLSSSTTLPNTGSGGGSSSSSSSSSSSGSTSSSAKTPKTPDTGVSLTGNHSIDSLLGVVLIAGALVVPMAVFKKVSKSAKK